VKLNYITVYKSVLVKYIFFLISHFCPISISVRQKIFHTQIVSTQWVIFYFTGGKAHNYKCLRKINYISKL